MKERRQNVHLTYLRCYMGCANNTICEEQCQKGRQEAYNVLQLEYMDLDSTHPKICIGKSSKVNRKYVENQVRELIHNTEGSKSISANGKETLRYVFVNS
jgi:hypothetical protein